MIVLVSSGIDGLPRQTCILLCMWLCVWLCEWVSEKGAKEGGRRSQADLLISHLKAVVRVSVGRAWEVESSRKKKECDGKRSDGSETDNRLMQMIWNVVVGVRTSRAAYLRLMLWAEARRCWQHNSGIGNDCDWLIGDDEGHILYRGQQDCYHRITLPLYFSLSSLSPSHLPHTARPSAQPLPLPLVRSYQTNAKSVSLRKWLSLPPQLN